MDEIKLLSNAGLLESFELAAGGVDPGPQVVDAIADIENAGEDKESVKNARKILIKYLETYMFGKEAEPDEEGEDYYEQELNGGKRSRRRRTRKGRKSRSRKSRKGRKGRKGRKR
jgi:hypothetical protein